MCYQIEEITGETDGECGNPEKRSFHIQIIRIVQVFQNYKRLRAQ